MFYILERIQSLLAYIYLALLNILFLVVLHEFFHVLMAKALGGKDIGVIWFHVGFASVSYELLEEKNHLKWMVRGAGGLGTAFILGILLCLIYIFLTPFNLWEFTVIDWLLTATIFHTLRGFQEIYEEVRSNKRT